jgi:hypothetical protein
MEIIFNTTKKHPTDNGPCNHEIVCLDKGEGQMRNYTYTSCVICGILLHHLSRDSKGKLYNKDYDYEGYWDKEIYGYPNPDIKEYKKNIKKLKQMLFNIPLTKKELAKLQKLHDNKK